MSVSSSQSVTVVFTTRVFSTGVGTNADSLPTGTLYLNGVANGATVTVTNITTGVYKAQVTLPSLAIGDVVSLAIAATVSTIADTAVIWSDTKDILLDASGDVTFNNTSIATVTTVTNQLTAAQIATGVWQDTTSGDFTVAHSIGKALYIDNVVPGGSGGHFIAGTNAATTVTTSFTTTFTGNLTGSVGSVSGNVGGNVTGSVGSVSGNVGGNVTGTIGGLTAAALAQYFTVNSGSTYSAAVAGSVVKEIASNAGSGGVVLASNGLDSVSTTQPTGVPGNFREQVNWLYMWFANKNVVDPVGGTSKVFAADNTTVVTTQTLTISGGAQTRGKVS